MFKQLARQSIARWQKGAVLCFLGLFFVSALFCFSPALAQDEVGQISENRSLVVRVWDWTVQAWQSVVNWVIEQGTHLVRAFSFSSPEIAALPLEPKVLGEETNQPPSPLTYKTELKAAEEVSEPVKKTPEPEPSLPENQAPELPPVVAPEPAEPTPVEVPGEPEAPPLVQETPAPAPEVIAPETTPEILPDEPAAPAPPAEPAKPNSSYYILILAQDTVPPTSQVSALAATSTAAAFTVSWTGQDTDITGNPEVRNYDIQYQVDSGDWTNWLLETVLLSETFTGANAKTYGFRSRARDRHGNTGEYPAQADTETYMELEPSYEVVINEIAWMGTRADPAHEWIELYNPGNSTVDLSNWTLKSEDGTPNITIESGKTIAAKSYFLLERTASTTVSNINEDQIFTDELGDGGELLVLRNSNGRLIDKAGSSSNWAAGDNTLAANRATMERKNPTSDGTASSNWATNDGTFITGQDSGANNIKGTPRSLNSQNTTIPRVVTNLQQQWIYTTTTSVKLYWTTPKFSHLATAPTTYDIRYYQNGADCPITESNFNAGTSVSGTPVPSTTEGTVQTATVTNLTQNTSYCFAMKTSNSNETSGLSNIYNGNTYDSGFTTLSFGGDTVSSNTTIATSTKPYLVNRNFTVAAGVTLTVNPGVVIKMNTNDLGKGCNVNNLACSITVNGRLILGSASDSVNGVVITSSRDDTYAGDANVDGSTTSPAAGNWLYITAPTAASILSFDNAIVRYGGSGSQMINIQSGAAATVNTSILEYSLSYGIQVSTGTSHLTMASSTVQHNLDGLGISNLATTSVSGSTFTDNRRGIAIDGTAGSPAGIISIVNSNFFSNNKAPNNPNAGIHYSGTSTLTAQSNWWGNENGPIATNPVTAPRDAAMFTAPGSIDYSSHKTAELQILPSGL